MIKSECSRNMSYLIGLTNLRVVNVEKSGIWNCYPKSRLNQLDLSSAKRAAEAELCALFFFFFFFFLREAKQYISVRFRYTTYSSRNASYFVVALSV